ISFINQLEKKVINATIFIPNMPSFKLGIAQLKKIDNDFSHVGIHLNLTEGNAFTNPKSINRNGKFLSLSKLLVKSKLRA
ncbi:hypothetical protein NAI38_10930, partial [Francisella tularensis subsp. holarctica]|nr:hypothetical protein [Francisella tularensis subsp. holarctica]